MNSYSKMCSSKNCKFQPIAVGLIKVFRYSFIAYELINIKQH